MQDRREEQRQQVLQVAARLRVLLEGMEAALASDIPKNELHLHSVMSRAVELDRVLAIYIHQ